MDRRVKQVIVHGVAESNATACTGTLSNDMENPRDLLSILKLGGLSYLLIRILVKKKAKWLRRPYK